MPRSTRRRCPSTSCSSCRSYSSSSSRSGAEMSLPSAREAANLFLRSLRGWSDDNASSMGAALAFYTLFSLAPLLLVALSLAGLFFDRSQAQDALIGQLAQLIG